MSRSIRKNTFHGNCATSDVWGKRRANRVLRRIVRAELDTWWDREIFPELRDVSDVWGFAKDGKFRFSSYSAAKLLRK